MKPVYIFLCCFYVLFLPAGQAAARVSPGVSSDSLCPPRFLQSSAPEFMASYLWWSKPMRADSTTPPGLLGYYLHGNGHRLEYIDGPNTLMHYHMWPKLGRWTYAVTAYYDLGYYGQPGQFGESPASNESILDMDVDFMYPLNENFDHGFYGNYNWHFSPDQGNWDADYEHGNPKPCMVFKGNPGETNYHTALISFWNPMNLWVCANVSLSVDLKLENVNPTGKEKLIIEAGSDSVWDVLQTFTNVMDTGWIHYRYDCNKYIGDVIMFRFTAAGVNSTDIAGWYLDNVKLDPVCLPPAGGKAVRQKNNINRISWVPPCAGSSKTLYPGGIIAGYFIYRSDSAGNPPFTVLNYMPFKDTVYYDTLPTGLYSNYFSYYLQTRFNAPGTNYYACESPPGDTLKVTSLSVASLEESEVLVYPNPSSADIIITGSITISGCEIWNTSGQMVELIRSNNTKELKLDVSKLVPGLYFLRIQTEKGVINRKLFRSAR